MTATKHIYCKYSGLPLASITALCSHGWPMINSFENTMVHPLYGFSLERLLSMLKGKIAAAEEIAWCVIDTEVKEMQVLSSAIMYSLGAMWVPAPGSVHVIEPSLPSWPVVVGSAKRLTQLASWYHYATSKRMKFPIYRVTKMAGNETWGNFSAWLDEAFEIKRQWEKGRAENVLREAEAKQREDAMETVRGERLFGRVDFNKVWNWVEVQMAEHADYPVGRRTTMKSLFMQGDLHPEDWTVDDVDDLQEALAKTCDIGNDVMFFINTRLNGIRANIQNFFSTFTIVGMGDARHEQDTTEHEKETTAAFFADFDKRADNLEELPAAPVMSAFATRGLFYKAQAQWNILKARFEMLQKRKQESENK